MITLNVNGSARQVDADPATPLLYVLRDELRLNGAKFGCGLGQCGACTVIVDGAAAFSCLIPISLVQQRPVRTIEGLGTIDKPGVVQQAFIDEQAAQCGYCIAGMIMRAHALLERKPDPSDAEIRREMAPNLCRCGTHMRILRAVRRASDMMLGKPVANPDRFAMSLGPALVSRCRRRSRRRLRDRAERRRPSAARRASRAADLPGSLAKQPFLDGWIRIGADGGITVFTGKAELGQGIKTALIQVAAEELVVAPDRIELVTADTERTAERGLHRGQPFDAGQRHRDPPRRGAGARRSSPASPPTRLGVAGRGPARRQRRDRERRTATP